MAMRRNRDYEALTASYSRRGRRASAVVLALGLVLGAVAAAVLAGLRRRLLDLRLAQLLDGLLAVPAAVDLDHVGLVADGRAEERVLDFHFRVVALLRERRRLDAVERLVEREAVGVERLLRALHRDATLVERLLE